ncbi:flavodoxin domain-containing protein [Kitasatospora sp. NBC_00374]|uniref:flavodoxin family protein n=1 Tax=Kitasatospora sp. NBC_00374 TaxID=2975964 RepID=UPI0030DE9E00
MQAVIVYESMYGNTREIAEAIAEGVHEAEPDASVTCVPVSEAGPDVTRAADLLVVGGPTHMHGMSTGVSRKLAHATPAKDETSRETEEDVAGSPGLRSWFHDLPQTESATHAAAFDTRADSRMAGGAANGIAHRLSHHHYDVMVEPEGFIVEEAEGPLRAGEIERAKAWGTNLV